MRFTSEHTQFAAQVRAFCARECGTLEQRDARTEGGTPNRAPDRIWAACGCACEYGMEGQVRRALAPPI